VQTETKKLWKIAVFSFAFCLLGGFVVYFKLNLIYLHCGQCVYWKRYIPLLYVHERIIVATIKLLDTILAWLAYV
jgi:hypothetical protein